MVTIEIPHWLSSRPVRRTPAGRLRAIADRQRREEVLLEYDRSGMTQKAFAKHEGIKYHTLVSWLAWRRKVGAVAGAKFAEVRLGSVGRPTALEVMLPNGLVVRGEEPARVADLVRALARAC